MSHMSNRVSLNVINLALPFHIDSSITVLTKIELADMIL